MRDLNLFRKQFLISQQQTIDLPWNNIKIDDYNLFYHPDLEIEHSSGDSSELYLLGFLFDYRTPGLSNKAILDNLAQINNYNSFIESLAEYSGHFVIIYKDHERFLIIGDAGNQREVYYDTSFTTFGSQAKLLKRYLNTEPQKDKEALNFYQSEEFLRRQEFINDTTIYGNIFHLLPNHLINIRKKKVERYFPNRKIAIIPYREAAAKAAVMLKGYIKAASLRYNLTMGVTGGFDSRLLFLASLDVSCKYYVTKRIFMDDSHYDIVIPKKLTGLLGKDFDVISERDELENDIKEALHASVDFPRNPKKSGSYFNDHIIINGNLSEIARNVFEYKSNLSAADLCYLYGFYQSPFVAKQYERWLSESARLFKEMGYDISDMFYWEQRMGIWAAKGKTEMDIIGKIVYSPFCSHSLLTELLSTKREHRNKHTSRLHYTIIDNLCPEAKDIPINPSRKTTLIKLMKKTGIFPIYQDLRLRFRFRKPHYLRIANYQ